MYKVLENLITKKYYATKEEIQHKVDVFYGFSRITDEEYMGACELIEANYPDPEPIIVEELAEDATDTEENI